MSRYIGSFLMILGVTGAATVVSQTLAVLITLARQGPQATHQICMQVWLAVSLLTDALAGRLHLARLGYTGGALAVILGSSFGSLANLFAKEAAVLQSVKSCTWMLIGAISSAVLYAPSMTGLPGVWLGVTLFMGLQMAAGYCWIFRVFG